MISRHQCDRYPKTDDEIPERRLQLRSHTSGTMEKIPCDDEVVGLVFSS